MRPDMRAYARTLRKKATEEENRLWYGFLRTYPVQFRRQTVFGRYIVDFFCAKARLVVELDGSQHYMDGGPACDLERTEALEQNWGLLVLRFTNLEVQQNLEGVCADIDRTVKGRFPHQSRSASQLPPSGGKPSRLGTVPAEKGPSPHRGEGGPEGRMRGRMPRAWKRGI